MRICPRRLIKAAGAGRVRAVRPVADPAALLYAVRVTLSLTDSQVTWTAWGQPLHGILRLIGQALLALALLALRGHVKR
jgi:hypothetical protein